MGSIRSDITSRGIVLEIKMPQLSEAMVGAKLLRWNVAVNDYVNSETILAEVEADKANMEIEAPSSGRVVALHGAPGEEIPVGAVLVELDEGAIAPEQVIPGGKPDAGITATPYESVLERRRAEQAAVRGKN